jgi:hypothetical protein
MNVRIGSVLFYLISSTCAVSIASEVIPLIAYGVTLEFEGKVPVKVKGRKDMTNRLLEIILSFNKKSINVPVRHLRDLNNSELSTIEYSEYTDNKRRLVSTVRMNYDRRIYKWGSATSQVTFIFKDHEYTGRELILPVGDTATKQIFEKYEKIE